jgi:hypothetical protein
MPWWNNRIVVVNTKIRNGENGLKIETKMNKDGKE